MQNETKPKVSWKTLLLDIAKVVIAFVTGLLADDIIF